jgi:hypothetical protein
MVRAEGPGSGQSFCIIQLNGNEQYPRCISLPVPHKRIEILIIAGKMSLFPEAVTIIGSEKSFTAGPLPLDREPGYRSWED